MLTSHESSVRDSTSDFLNKKLDISFLNECSDLMNTNCAYITMCLVRSKSSYENESCFLKLKLNEKSHKHEMSALYDICIIKNCSRG